MFNSTVLEVAIGLIFVYLLLSMICSSLNEVIAGILATRSKTLKQGIRSLLAGDDDILGKIYANPLIKSLHRQTWFDKFCFKRERGPSYIPAHTFALALFDTVTHEKNGVQVAEADSKDLQKYAENSFAAMESSINAISNDAIKRPLGAILKSAKEQAETWEEAIAEARKSTEQWFDDTMDRVTGWYARKTQIIMAILAVIIVGGANIDTIMISRNLAEDSILRASITAAAADFVNNPDVEVPDSSYKKVEILTEKLKSFSLPIGWTKDNSWEWEFNKLISKLAGLLLTAIAVSFGAPFWFDLLKKLINVRFAGKTDSSTAGKEEKKEVVNKLVIETSGSAK
jgi:hypothetical protein